MEAGKGREILTSRFIRILMIPVRNSTKQKRQILGQRQKEAGGAQEWPEGAM